MSGDEAPAWLGRAILCDELRAAGLPWVPEAWGRRPADVWLTLDDRHEAVKVAGAITAAIRRRGVPCGHELRDAAWRLVVAGLGRLPRDRWPTIRMPGDFYDEPAPEADDPDPDHDPDPEPVGEPEPLVIRRREGGRPHAK
jgi:hypothetical protein